MGEQQEGEALKETIHVETGPLQGHIAELVRSSVEETLNGLLEAEAETMCPASRDERAPERADTEPVTISGSWRRRPGQ